MNLIFMGTPDFSVPALRALAARHNILAVYTQPPRPAGRGQKERLSPVHQAALDLGIPVRHPANFRDPADVEAFAALNADAAVVVAYGLLLPKSVLSAPAKGCLNIHASLLPRWRGAAPIHRAILEGDPQTGICIMQMDEGLDTGPVLLRRTTPIGPEDTTGDLHDRLAAMGAEMITETLDRLDSLTPEPQPDTGITYAKKIDKAEARIDWTHSAEQVARQINGLSPFPGAWCLMGTERLKLLRARAVPGSGQPGQTLQGLTIACGTGAVAILLAQREGKRPMEPQELLRGLTLPPTLA